MGRGGARRRRRRRSTGYRNKNKNPTQSCGEKTSINIKKPSIPVPEHVAFVCCGMSRPAFH
jgi:hypothetical protein